MGGPEGGPSWMTDTLYWLGIAILIIAFSTAVMITMAAW